MRTELVWCPGCDDYFERQITTGPKPKACPKHAERIAYVRALQAKRDRYAARIARELEAGRDARVVIEDGKKLLAPVEREVRRMGSLYVVPAAGETTTVQLATQANDWDEYGPVEVEVLGRPRAVPCGRCVAIWVRCRVPGEDHPRDVAIERFPEADEMRRAS